MDDFERFWARARRRLLWAGQEPAFRFVIVTLMLGGSIAGHWSALWAFAMFGTAAIIIAAVITLDDHDDDPQHPVPGWDKKHQRFTTEAMV